jgi:TolA-binding protein
MEAQIEELQNRLAVYEGQADTIPEQTASYEALLSAYVAFTANDAFTTGDNLEKVDKAQLSASAKEIYSTLWDEVRDVYYEKVYQKGYDSYASGHYQDAVEMLLRVVEYDKSYKTGNAAYYLAQAYNRGGDMEAAIPYYQYILDNFPNTEKAATAKNYINAN